MYEKAKVDIAIAIIQAKDTVTNPEISSQVSLSLDSLVKSIRTLTNGLHFDYSEDVFIDYRKQLERSWRPSEGLLAESSGRSNHQFFLIM
ncbi:hypothetical protein NPIL_421541 [Nephila pilipes]|uniref:Uncharacterized protein n=1 Tax=Nephila pilipes TaxID=299642 RepID=A0A8X6UBZ8_NEPPI|nr:hypothetical protein NPIL_421541 [Nephila pilipes]